MVAEEGGSSENHTVTVQMTVEDGGVQYGIPVTQMVNGDTVIIEWDDEWQRNFNWSLTIGDKSYEGWIGDEFVTTDNYSFEQIYDFMAFRIIPKPNPPKIPVKKRLVLLLS